MNIIRLILTLISSIIMDILGFFLVPIALIFTREEDDMLPKIFYPWDNYEDTINGDKHWSNLVGKENITKKWYRFKWLALRNPSHNFVKRIIGVKNTGDKYYFIGDSWEKVSTYNGYHKGLYDGKYLQILYHNKWIYIRIGWKYKKEDRYLRFATIIKRG